MSFITTKQQCQQQHVHPKHTYQVHERKEKDGKVTQKTVTYKCPGRKTAVRR